MLASLMLAGRKTESERKGENSFTPPQCMRAPKWSSLCWLVERERERGKMEGGMLPFSREQD
jgi:hypothetical protein